MKDTGSINNLNKRRHSSQQSDNYKNYITPGGHARLINEFSWLMNKERPKITATVSWAAGNGDRSENGDYIYGKKRLREIDKRIHYLTKRLDIAEIIDPTISRDDETQIFFGATVTFTDLDGKTETISIVGVDEIDTTKGYISWTSPMAKALIKSREGDIVNFITPAGIKKIEVLKVKYKKVPIEIFVPPK